MLLLLLLLLLLILIAAQGSEILDFGLPILDWLAGSSVERRPISDF